MRALQLGHPVTLTYSQPAALLASQLQLNGQLTTGAATSPTRSAVSDPALRTVRLMSDSKGLLFHDTKFWGGLLHGTS